MMELTEHLVAAMCNAVCDTRELPYEYEYEYEYEYGEHTVSVEKLWRRVIMKDTAGVYIPLF